MMNKITLLLFLVAHVTFAALTPVSETDRDVTTIKLWGFLKYYHPQVAKGKFDWDKELFNIRDKTTNAHDKEALSQIYSSWIDGLGKIPTCKSCAKPSKKDHFDKNFDLSWTQDQNIFTPELSAKLKFIEANRHQGKSHYAGTHKNVGNIKILNEKDYLKHDWQDQNIRLLSLARYWNQVEYFSPYKYMTDQKWDDVLREMVPKFTNPATEQDYHLAMLELVVKMDDSHAGFVSKTTNNYFGFYWAPVDYKIIGGKAIIDAIYDDSLATAHDLQIGDVIEKVNGEPVATVLARQMKYINGSNLPVKLRNSYYCLLNGQTGTVNITVSRNGQTTEKTVARSLKKGFNTTAKPKKKAWEIMQGNVGYVNMGRLEFNIKNVDRMMDSLMKTDAIIFDIRNYPQGTMYLIARRLNRPTPKFVHFTQPDLNYPGKFIWRKDFNDKPNTKGETYNGKIVLLVNETTQSHAEFTAMCFQTAANVTTIGSQTSGADGNVSTVIFPGGHRSYITGLGVFYPDGTETQRKGVKIDIEVKPTIEGIRAGRDEVLEKAFELLGKNYKS